MYMQMRQNWFFLPQRWEGRQRDFYQDRIFKAIEITSLLCLPAVYQVVE